MKNKLPEHPFLVMDASSDMAWHKDLSSAIRDAEERIAGYREESWANGEWDDEDVTSVAVLEFIRHTELECEDEGYSDAHLIETESSQKTDEVITHWKKFHSEISDILGVKYNSVSCTKDRAKEIVDELKSLKNESRKMTDSRDVEARQKESQEFAGSPKPIDTERFEIHVQSITRPQCTGGISRDVYQAWLKQSTTGEDVSKPLVIVTIGWLNFVEWVHVDEQFRRRGMGTEVLRAIEEQIGTLTMDGATDAGNAFCDAYEETYPSLSE